MKIKLPSTAGVLNRVPLSLTLIATTKPYTSKYFYIFSEEFDTVLVMLQNELLQPHLINSLIVVDISPVRTSPAIIDLSLMFDAMLSVKLENNIPLSKARQNVDQQLKEIVPVRKIFYLGSAILHVYFDKNAISGINFISSRISVF